MWIPFMILIELTVPLTNTSNQTIWMSKVAPDVQGRVFSARRLIAWFAQPIAPIIGGTLSDYVLEPAMKTHSGLASLFGPIFGTGPGSGMGLLFAFCGLAVAAVGIIGLFHPPDKAGGELAARPRPAQKSRGSYRSGINLPEE